MYNETLIRTDWEGDRFPLVIGRKTGILSQTIKILKDIGPI